MDKSTCGDCRNFQPPQNEKFFNCTRAKQAGIGYGMQVRADTRACDAFAPSDLSSIPKPHLATERAQPAKSQSWKKALLLITLLALIALLSLLLYNCVSESTSEPVLTPTPNPGSISTPGTEPEPSSTSSYIIQYFDIGTSLPAISQDRIITVYSTSRVTSYTLLTGRIINAPPANVFIFVNLNAINRGSTSLKIGEKDFSLIDSDGYQYSSQTGSSPYYVGDPFGTILSPGQIEDGKLLYVLPITASGLELSYNLDPTSKPPVIARWKLPW